MKQIEDAVKQKIIRIIETLIPDTRVYLFGSRARQTHSEWSDIDLALDVGRELPIVAVDEVVSMLSASNIPYKIEIVDVYRVSPEMRDSIEKEKVIWK